MTLQSDSPVYKQNPKFIITIPADALEPGGAKPQEAVLTFKVDMSSSKFLSVSMISYDFWSYNIIHNDQGDPEKSCAMLRVSLPLLSVWRKSTGSFPMTSPSDANFWRSSWDIHCTASVYKQNRQTGWAIVPGWGVTKLNPC